MRDCIEVELQVLLFATQHIVLYSAEYSNEPYVYTVNIRTNFIASPVGVEKAWLWREPKKKNAFCSN